MSGARANAAADEAFDAHDAVRKSRLRLADYLDDLEPDDWTRPSLCEGWTVSDVVAHLSLSTTETWRDFIVGMIRNLGNFDRWNATSARDQARRHIPHKLVTILRDQADSRDHSPGSSTLDQLVDLLVHGQDISRAIDSPFEMPLIPAVEAFEHALGSRWYGAKKRFSGIRLSATDTHWESGTGHEIRGPVSSLLLLATGREAGLAQVEGPGVDTVGSRIRSA